MDNISKNIHTFLSCNADYTQAQAVLFGAPFDGTTSFRPGTRFGPSAIRNESFGIETYSPYCDKDLADYRIFDGGDLELPFGNTERVLRMFEDYTEQLLTDNKRFVMLGGEHLVTLGALRAVVRRYPDLHILHLDAHTDLRDEYIYEKLSHSTVMRRAWELVGDGKIHQFGIRSGEKYEFAFAQTHTKLRKFDLAGFEQTVARLKDQPVYFTLDLDILDSSVFCGTGTPEAGGVTFKELIEAILQLSRLNIVGSDIVELSPHYDQSCASTAVACKITREVLLQICHPERS